MPASRASSQTSARSPGRRSGATAQKEVIELLKEDHKRAKKAFRDFEKLDRTEERERCQKLVEQVCADLELHAELEEELFYPAAREALDETDLVDEALVEHMTVKRLIADLKALAPDDEKYAATFTVLGEYVKHHVAEEEGELFPQLEKTKIDWQSLQQQMMQRREEQSGTAGDEAGEDEMDEETDDDEEEDEDESSPGDSSGRSRRGGKRSGGGSGEPADE